MFAHRMVCRALVFAFAIASSAIPALAAGKIVISQLYGGGGNTGATYKNDFIELYNSGDTAVSVAGWSVQYGSSGGTTWQVTNLSGTIQPGQYYLVQEAVGAGGTTNLPTPDATGTIPMSATAGKVAISTSITAFSGPCPSGAVDFVAFGSTNCSEGSSTGATSSPTLSNTTAAIRIGGGCQDSDNNKTDFPTTPTAPNPRNSSSALNACLSVTGVSAAEGNSGTTSFNFTAQLNVATTGTVSFNASTADGTAQAGSDYTALTNAPFSIAAGSTSVTIPVLVTGDTVVEPDETFTVTLSNISGASPVAPTLSASGTILNDDIAAVTLSFSPTTIPDGTEGVAYSQTLTVVNGDTCTFSSTGALPAGITLSFTGANNQATLSGTPSFATSSNFTISANCAAGSTFQAYSVNIAFACESGAKTSTPIHTVQGSGATSALTGQVVEVEGIVVGAFQSTTQLRGFYLQEPDSTWDADPLTSEGVFVFDNGAGAAVNVGDRVRVQGTVAEFTSSGSFLGVTQGSSLTEVGTIAKKLVCSSGNSFTRTTVMLPTANAGDLERYEGMAIQFAQQLTVTGNFSLGTQGWLDLAPSVLFVPTRTANQANWPAQTSLNSRSVVALDDASTLTNTNLYPTLFPSGGLSAADTLRIGSLVNYDAGSQTNTPLIGIMDDRFGEYRVQPTAPVTFYAANPRPDIAPLLTGVGGRFRAVSANVLNFFVSLGSRGAATSTEFDHQKTKVIEALYAMNADVYGLSEVQNFNDGNTGNGSNTYTNAALQSIVDGLNCKASGLSPLCSNPPTIVFAMIDTLPLGSGNGTDAIRSAIVYKPSVLTPVGGPATYYQNDTNRPTVAQTFKPATGAKADSQTFTFVVNHFRSRSSACSSGNDTYQGNCNGLRLDMATNVVTWLNGNPTADPAGASRRILIVGDFNAYYGEDPIQYFANHGYPNLINAIIGPGGYSYNFGSQAGYLDHGIANNAMNALVRSIAEWHNNSDEPSSLQALNSSIKSAAAQAAYYGADPWAASDHDPFVVGFNTLPGDLNDDGVVNTADQALLTASVGKSASQADRRMDYDGDGKITLNDYRIWATYYKAFIQ
jgi:predicted extracellular nuclease